MKMAGPLHPPCRRKKLRPLRPRLTARTAFCSVPSSSPHAAGRAGAPVFLPEEKETAPAGACRRPTAAKRRLLGRRQTGRARSTGRLLMAPPFRAAASPLRGKEKKKCRPAGDGGRGDAQEVLPPDTHVSSPRRSAAGGVGDCRMDFLRFPLPHSGGCSGAAFTGLLFRCVPDERRRSTGRSGAGESRGPGSPGFSAYAEKKMELCSPRHARGEHSPAPAALGGGSSDRRHWRGESKGGTKSPL